MYYCWVAIDKITKQVVAACGEQGQLGPVENLGKFLQDTTLEIVQINSEEVVDRNFLVFETPEGKILVPNPDPNPPVKPPDPIDVARVLSDIKNRLNILES